MENKEAVAALVNFIIPKDSTPADAYHVMLGVLLKLSSIPSFAKEVRACSLQHLQFFNDGKGCMEASPVVD